MIAALRRDMCALALPLSLPPPLSSFLLHSYSPSLPSFSTPSQLGLCGQGLARGCRPHGEKRVKGFILKAGVWPWISHLPSPEAHWLYVGNADTLPFSIGSVTCQVPSTELGKWHLSPPKLSPGPGAASLSLSSNHSHEWHR